MSTKDDTKDDTANEKKPEPTLEPPFPYTFLAFDPGFVGVDTLPEEDAQSTT